MIAEKRRIDCYQDLCKMDGFIIRQPYSGQIIKGTKKFEFRNFQTAKLNTSVYLLSEGHVLGKIMFTEIKKRGENGNMHGKLRS